MDVDGFDFEKLENFSTRIDSEMSIEQSARPLTEFSTAVEGADRRSKRERVLSVLTAGRSRLVLLTRTGGSLSRPPLKALAFLPLS